MYIEVESKNRSEIVSYLNSQNIQARPVPPSLHESKYLENFGHYPNSKRFAKECFYLPSGPGQTKDNIEQTIKALKKYFSILL